MKVVDFQNLAMHFCTHMEMEPASLYETLARQKRTKKDLEGWILLRLAVTYREKEFGKLAIACYGPGLGFTSMPDAQFQWNKHTGSWEVIAVMPASSLPDKMTPIDTPVRRSIDTRYFTRRLTRV